MSKKKILSLSNPIQEMKKKGDVVIPRVRVRNLIRIFFVKNKSRKNSILSLENWNIMSSFPSLLGQKIEK